VNKVTTNARTRWLRCAGLLLGVALPAYGQQDGGAGIVKIDKIEVTGSNIRRADIETALPLQIITREDIERSGAITAAALMSQVSANLVGRTDVPYNTSIGNSQAGLSSANLRGLGDGSALVLLNGRRAANYAANGATVNLNFIPIAAVERVEILKDGASAIYGADAIAGVINFILRKDFRGAQFSAYGDETQHGGGNQKQASVTAGYGDLAVDRFNVFVTASYQKDEVLHARDRPFSRTGFRPDEGVMNVNRETFPANIRMGPSTLLNPTFAAGCMPPVTLPMPGTEMCIHDTLAVVNILPPVERSSVFGGATWQLNADHQLFAQYLYSYDRYIIVRNTAPTSQDANPDRRQTLYPAGGPFYPTEFAAAHGITGDLNLYYRTAPLGPITDKLQTDAHHLVLGAQGVVAGWNYDAAWIYSENTQEYFGVSGRVSERRLLAAMASGLINPFGPSGPEGDALLASTEAPGQVFHDKAITDSVEIKASSEIYALPAGALAVALGAEARRERLDIIYSPEQTSGDILGSTTAKSTSGRRSAQALFAELNMPIAKGLEAQLAARYDHYSDFGNTTNPKVALRWQPAKSLLFRSSYGTGFRAPTLPDLFTPLTSGFTRLRYSDPLRCSVTHLLSDCDVSFPVVSGGNPDLAAEKSEQYNVGAVWEFLTGFSVAVDYWNISKTETIGALTDATLFTYFDRFKDTNFIRGPVDPAFPALPGPIVNIFERRQNLGKLHTSGTDVDVSYRGPGTSIGRFGLSLSGSYVAQWKQQLDGVNYISAVGRSVVGAVPRWRHYLSLKWDQGPWGATLAQTFSCGYIDENLNAAGKERRVGSYDVWDAQGTYTGFRNTTIALGIRNLFDRAPPFSNQSSFGQVMYDPRYADPRGRMFYAQVTLAFK
jgi:iron complex outermembrane receptor protein